MSVKVISRTPRPTTIILLRISLRPEFELCGTEVKSIRQGNVNLKDAYCIIKDGEIAVTGCTSPL